MAIPHFYDMPYLSVVQMLSNAIVTWRGLDVSCEAANIFLISGIMTSLPAPAGSIARRQSAALAWPRGIPCHDFIHQTHLLGHMRQHDVKFGVVAELDGRRKMSTHYGSQLADDYFSSKTFRRLRTMLTVAPS